jgi:hypothetical protein
MKKPGFIVLKDGIQPVFANGGFKVVKIMNGAIAAYYGDKVYKTYAGALKLAAKMEAVK